MRKGDGLLSRAAFGTSEAEDWANVAAEYLMANVDAKAAERFLKLSAPPGSGIRGLIGQQLIALGLTARELETPSA